MFFGLSKKNINIYIKKEDSTYKEIASFDIVSSLCDAYNLIHKMSENDFEIYSIEWQKGITDIFSDFESFMTQFKCKQFISPSELKTIYIMLIAYSLASKKNSLASLPLDEAHIGAIDTSITVHVAFIDEQFITLYKPNRFSQILLYSILYAIQAKLEPFIICDYCKRGFFKKSRIDEHFCSTKCRKKYYHDSYPLRTKIDSKQNLIRRELITYEDEPYYVELVQAYTSWNKHITKRLPKEEQKLKKNIEKVSSNLGHTLSVNEVYSLNFVTTWSDYLKQSWKEAKNNVISKYK